MRFANGDAGSRIPDPRTLLWLCAVACLANILLVSALAGAGVLQSAERGDITYTRTEETPDGPFTLPADSPDRFVVERPTDADAYYNMVVRVRNGGPMFNPWGGPATIQKYHYFPIWFYLFFPLTLLGYVGFKVVLLVLSLLLTMGGTWLLVQAELHGRSVTLSRRSVAALSVLSVGFAPMVANFKVGQVAPLIYVFIGGLWWAYRTGKTGPAGVLLLGAALLKPYFMTPLVLFGRHSRLRGLAGFGGGFAVANALVALTFGSATLVRYYEILVSFVIEKEGAVFVNTGFDVWVATNLRMFFWFGDLAPVVSLLFAVPLAWLTLVYVFNEQSFDVELFALALLSPMFLIRGTSVTDLAVVLAAVIVLGVRFYGRDRVAFGLLSLSFLLMHGHPYFLEATVGVVGENVALLAANEQLVVSIVPYLQPGMYGLLICLGLCVYSAVLRAGVFPLPQFGRWRHALGLAD